LKAVWAALAWALAWALTSLVGCAQRWPPEGVVPTADPAATATVPAPRPLYRDPLWDGAADAALVQHRASGRWDLFYTNRRATLRLPDAQDVRWVHGSHIGIASSRDGHHWQHAGVAQFPAECTGGAPETSTHWAPEVVAHAGRYHLWLTVVPGIHARWTGTRFLQHLSSDDLRHWRCGERLDLGSDRVIDAAVARLDDGRWRLWFKDENQGSRLFQADSQDLRTWRRGPAVTDAAAEGAKVFRFTGHWWLVADQWRGLLVQRSSDATHWQVQPQRLLTEAGRHATDRAKGQHPDVLVLGGRAFLFYFVHQGGEDAARQDDRHHQRSVIQVAELKLQDGWLTVDRNADPPDLRALFGGTR
jgi:hypothetical protein